jgi:predicted nuclease of predicted toxin-antitoxin system
LRLLLDEMYPPRLAEELRRRGHEVIAVAEIPELRASEDEVLLLAATADRRVLVTENIVDYPEIVATLNDERQVPTGVILVSSRSFPRTERGLGALVRALDGYLGQRADEDTVPGGIHWLVPLG